MSNQATFSVIFDGESVESGEISVKDLAPSLLALSDYLEHLNTIVNGPESQFSLKIKANKEGSFEAVLSAVVSDVINLLNSSGIDALANLLALSGLQNGVPGIIQYFLVARQSAPENIESISESQFKITFPDGTELAIDKGVLPLISDPEVRDSLAKFIQPLRQDGVDEIRLRRAALDSASTDSDEDEIRITREDITSFDEPEETEEEILETETEKYFSIVSLAFKEDNKWRLTDGEKQINVTILDQHFLAAVNNSQIRFAKSDLLRVRLRERQSMTSTGRLSTVYEILKVLEHIPRKGQIGMFDEPS